MTVRTRFAPSPTGYLHIGGARTALFNYLFAKKHNGQFLVRVEDTDLERSTEAAKQAIINSLKWLNLMPDEDIIYQTKNVQRHQQVAQELIDKGKAFYCFTPQEEINKLREEAISQGKHFIFNSPWRDANANNYPKDQKPVVRLKTPHEGYTVVSDLLQGEIKVENNHLDDMVLLRGDGTPTYMLAVVVDDHDMGITHIIRGDDHLNNASRQQLIYEAMGWDVPKMVHIPLIHGPDGAKLSKRHGALGVESYKDMGYLAEALNNYLLRLGWSHGDDEFITREDAVKWFDVEHLGKSPSRIDFDKMKFFNAHYLREMENQKLAEIIFDNLPIELSAESKNDIILAVPALKPRAELITDLCDLAKIFIVENNIEYSDEALALIEECDKKMLEYVIKRLEQQQKYDKDSIQALMKEIAKEHGIKLGELMKYLRAYITGRTASPSVFEIIAILGQENTIKRLKK